MATALSHTIGLIYFGIYLYTHQKNTLDKQRKARKMDTGRLFGEIVKGGIPGFCMAALAHGLKLLPEFHDLCSWKRGGGWFGDCPEARPACLCGEPGSNTGNAAACGVLLFIRKTEENVDCSGNLHGGFRRIFLTMYGDLLYFFYTADLDFYPGFGDNPVRSRIFTDSLSRCSNLYADLCDYCSLSGCRKRSGALPPLCTA